MQIWAIARHDLQLPEDEIGRLSIREFDALLERKRACDNRTQLNFGIVAAAVVNAAPNYSDKPREPVSPLDFVPEWSQLKEEESLNDEQKAKRIKELLLGDQLKGKLSGRGRL